MEENMEAEQKALQGKCQTFMDLWAQQKVRLGEADEIAKVAKAAEEANYSLADANAKLHISLASERHRAYLTECRLNDATIKIQHLEWKLADQNSLIRKEKDRESKELKLKELELQLGITAKSMAIKDEQLKKITQRLEVAYKENESLLSKCFSLEGNLERKSAKTQVDYEEKLKEMEDQHAKTLVGKLDRRIESHVLAESGESCAALEARWIHRHSEAVEMLENQLKDTERRCTEANTAIAENENTLRKVKQQLENIQKENNILKTQLSKLERQEEWQASLGDRGTKLQKARAASTRNPFTVLSNNDIRSSKRGARGQMVHSLEGPEKPMDTASDEQALGEGEMNHGVNAAPTPIPMRGSFRKRPLNSKEAVEPTPPTKRRPPINGVRGTSSKSLANTSSLGGAVLAQLLVGSTPLGPVSIGTDLTGRTRSGPQIAVRRTAVSTVQEPFHVCSAPRAPQETIRASVNQPLPLPPSGIRAAPTGSKRKLGSFAGSLMKQATK